MLFTPFRLRDLTLKNRIVMSPMCQYSCQDGVANDWHLMHLGARAAGGVGLVMVEATGVSSEGRISPADMGLWNDEQERALARVVRFIHERGAHVGVQLAHAGRKASTTVPWEGDRAAVEGGWTPLSPGAEKFSDAYAQPRAMTEADIAEVVRQFARATERAERAGFDVVEIHMAHGYLVHEFLSPLTNKRTDGYGGSLENRMRFALEIARAVRATWPARKPLFARISASDWVEGGWNVTQSVELARQLKAIGVDLIDCSSGGIVPNAKIEVKPGYQVPFAEKVRAQAGMPTGAVGLITEARQAEEILTEEKADLIFLARALLNDPHWALHAARELGVDVEWPRQYGRAKRR